VEFSRDYTGRQVDIEALQTAETPAYSIPLSTTLSDKNKHRRITGIQKLLQRYAILFLTQKGSVPFFPLQGTNFVRVAQQGGMSTRESVVHYFSFANFNVRENLLQEQDNPLFGDMPDDEKFESASLVDYVIDTRTSYLYLKVRLFSVAGDSATFIIPVQ
jgi:hypothetical protein